MAIDASPMVIPHFLAGITCLGLGTYVIKINYKDITSRVFFALMLACGVWSVGEFIMQLTKIDLLGTIGGISANVGFVFIPVTLLHFAILYTKKARKEKGKKKKGRKKLDLMPFLYVPSIIIAILLLGTPDIFFTVEAVEERGPDLLIDGNGGGLNVSTTGEMGQPQGCYRRLFRTSYGSNNTYGENINNWYFRDLDSNGKYGFNNSIPEPIMYIEPVFLFNWSDVPGADDEKLMYLLEEDLGVVWNGTPKIKRHEKQSLIMVSDDNGIVMIRLVESTGQTFITLKDDERFEYGISGSGGNVTVVGSIETVLFDTSYFNYSGSGKDEGAGVIVPADMVEKDGNITWISLSFASNNGSIYWIDSRGAGVVKRFDEGEKLILDNGNLYGGTPYFDIVVEKVYENYQYVSGPAYKVIIVLFFIFIIGSLGYFFKEYLVPKNAAVRKQIRYMLAGLFLIIVFILIGFLLQAMGLGLLGRIWDSLLTLLLSIFFAVAVLRYNLMDVKVIIKKSLTYSIIVLVMAIIFTIIGESLEFLTGKMLPELSEFLSNIVSALIVSMLFMPIIDYTKKFLNRLFPKLAKYEKEYVERISAYEATLEAMWQDRELTTTEIRALGTLRKKLNITQKEHDEIMSKRVVKS